MPPAVARARRFKLQLMTDSGIKPLSELLPWAFGPEEIDKRLD
jgi:cytidine deaminase